MSATSRPETPSSKARLLPLGIILCVAVAGAFLLKDILSFQTLAENRGRLLELRDAHFGLMAVGFVAVYAAVVAFSLPGATVMTLTGGFLFSTFPGVLFNMTGATLGAIGIFLAARWGLGERLAEKMQSGGGRIQKIKAGIDANQWEMLFLIRLIPVVPFFVANLVPALVGVALLPFAVTTFLGIIPGALVYTSVGAGLGEVLDRGEIPDLGIIFTPAILLPILGLAALAALPIVLKALRGKEGL